MPIIHLPNKHFMLVEETRYPQPRLRFSFVYDYGDIKFFDTGVHTPNGQKLQSLVYFYADRAVLLGRTTYVGQTKVTVASRHNSTHSKSDWVKTIQLPLIGVVESLDLSWDTDMRLAIEARLAWKLQEKQFAVSNSENRTWQDGGELLLDDREAYVEDAAELMSNTMLALLGLPSNHIFEELNATPEIKELLGSNKSETRRKIGNPLFEHPQEGRKLIAQQNGVTLHAIQTSDGKVIVKEINNLRPYLSATGQNAKFSHIAKGQERLLGESVKNSAGFYNWTGNWGPLAPTVPLAQAFGTPSPNMWKENHE